MDSTPPPIRLDHPYHVPGVREVSVRESGPDLRFLAALALFRTQRISSGKAAEIAGRSKAEFIDELNRRGIPYFTETPDELAAQVEVVRAVLGKRT